MFAVAMFHPAPEGRKDNEFPLLAFNLVQSPGDLLLDMLSYQYIIVSGNIA